MIATVAPRWGTTAKSTVTTLEAFALVLGAVVAAGSVIVLGLSSLIIATYVLALVWALLAPRSFAMVMLVVLITFETDAVDFTGPIGKIIWHFPTAIEQGLPLGWSPFDYLLLVTVFSLAMRAKPKLAERHAGFPLLLWAIPLAVILAYVYGVFYKHGPSNIAHAEIEGLMMAACAFFVTLRLRNIPVQWLHRAVFVGTSAHAVIVIARYLVFVQGKTQDELVVALPQMFEHGDVLMLGVGAVYGAVLLLRPRPTTERLLLLSYEVLMVTAVTATERRSGTLVIMMALLVIVVLLLIRKPMITMWVSVVILAAGAVYMASYWNQDSGAAAQPARAIRSQIDPSRRDSRSDQYRETERYNVIRTIHDAGPLFGVGLGRSYAAYIPVVIIPWWPLQFVTPHDNILWIWLKFGLFGVGALLGTWVIALKRSLRAFFGAPRDGPIPILPLALAASLVMFFAFAKVDVLLVSVRGAAPLGILLALAFTLPAENAVRARDAVRSAL